MQSTSTFRNRWTVLVAVLVAATMAAALTTATFGTADAQPTGECAGDVTRVFGNPSFDGRNKLFSNRATSERVTQRTYAMTTQLAAGRYALSGASYDGYTNRENTKPQANEIFVADFVGADGTVLATSSPSGDLADGVSEADWTGSMGSIDVSAPIASIIVRHGYLTDASPNSLQPVCIGFTNTTPADPCVVDPTGVDANGDPCTPTTVVPSTELPVDPCVADPTGVDANGDPCPVVDPCDANPDGVDANGDPCPVVDPCDANPDGVDANGDPCPVVDPCDANPDGVDANGDPCPVVDPCDANPDGVDANGDPCPVVTDPCEDDGANPDAVDASGDPCTPVDPCVDNPTGIDADGNPCDEIDPTNTQITDPCVEDPTGDDVNGDPCTEVRGTVELPSTTETPVTPTTEEPTTEVRGAVEIAPAANPVAANPAFAG